MKYDVKIVALVDGKDVEIKRSNFENKENKITTMITKILKERYLRHDTYCEGEIKNIETGINFTFISSNKGFRIDNLDLNGYICNGPIDYYGAVDKNTNKNFILSCNLSNDTTKDDIYLFIPNDNTDIESIRYSVNPDYIIEENTCGDSIDYIVYEDEKYRKDDNIFTNDRRDILINIVSQIDEVSDYIGNIIGNDFNTTKIIKTKFFTISKEENYNFLNVIKNLNEFIKNNYY